MNFLRLAPKLPLYYISRRLYTNTPLPFNLTISVTNKCNSRCKTCNIWKKNEGNELNSNEWKNILKSVGESPAWITISGGEPFLRKDLIDIADAISKYNNPAVLNMATNGILTEKIERDVKKILSFYKGRLIINISLDGVGKKHDYIRGVECFEHALKTYNTLKKIKNKNLIIGIHTVISKYNIKDFEEIHTFVSKLNPNSFIVEIAENRKELLNLKSDIAPLNEEYFKVIDFLGKNKIKPEGISRITQIFRNKYYKTTKDYLEQKKQRAPCYAGIASCQINFNGDMVICCMKGEVIGNLKKKSFKELWRSRKAEKIRARIKDEKCFCTLANVYYSNRICEII